MQTPLHLATKGKDDPDRVTYMMGKGADIRARNLQGKTPLHLAAQRGRVAVTRILMEAGEDPDFQSLKGLSALTFAAAHGHLCTVNLLLEKGALINTTDITGQTPLHYSAHRGHTAVAKTLLRTGADPNIRSDKGGRLSTSPSCTEDITSSLP